MREYFSHDYHARSDEKMVKMLRVLKPEGYGLYWMIVEMLYENGGSIPKDYDTIAYELRTDSDRIKNLCEGFALFSEKDGRIFSESVSRRLEERSEKSAKAKSSAAKRWGGDAVAVRSHSEGIADSMRTEGYKRKEEKRKEEKRGEGEQTPPTIHEVRELAEAEKLNADPDKYFHWQENKKWEGVSDWRASFRYWCRQEFVNTKKSVETPKERPLWEDTEAPKIKKKNEWHDRHLKGGKCHFCGSAVPAVGVCECKAYSTAFSAFCAKEGI